VSLFERGWIFAGKLLKGFIKVRNVFKAAFKTRLRHRLILHQYLFRLVDPKLVQKIGERKMSRLFKIPAKGSGCQLAKARYFIYIDLRLVICFYEMINLMDALLFF
jgi:hypothetical protein